jgi:hypothetical protein
MPNNSEQPTGNSSGRDHSEDSKLEERRGVFDRLLRYMGYRVSD